TLRSLTIAPTNPMVAAGLSLPLTATGHFSDNSTQDLTASVVWESSDLSVATIITGSDGAGTLTGQTQGNCTITATLGMVTINVPLQVSAAVLKSIDVSPSPAAFAIGTQLQASATGHFSDGSKQDLTTQVTWSSGDDNTATVSNASGSEGLVSSVAPGSTTLS